MSVLTFIESIGDFFVGLFNKVEKAWKQLSPEIKAATLQASGIIAIINANVSATPAVIWSLIETQFPGITQESVTSAIVKANNTVNAVNTVADTASFEEALLAIQKYLSGLEGNKFIIVVKTVVTLLADVFAPGETIIQKIELVLEYVYQELVKPHVPLAQAA